MTYLGFVAGLAPRFLLPAYAFLSVPAGVALSRLRLRDGRTRAVAGATIAVLLAWTGLQLATARMIGRQAATDRSQFPKVASILGRLAHGGPCDFRSVAGFPQIQLDSGCPGAQLSRRPPAGGARFLVVPRDAAVRRGWRPAEVVPGTRWRIDGRST